MSDLETQHSGGPDVWLEVIAGSREAAVVSETGLRWRCFQIESQCRYTSRLLKRMGFYESEVAKYFESNSTLPSIEKLTTGFLRSLAAHPDALVASVAKFELACLEVNESVKRSRIIWDRHPGAAIRALEESTDLPPAEPEHQYSMELGMNRRDRVLCTRFETPARIY